MNVAELIEVLKTEDPCAEVICTSGPDDDRYAVSGVSRFWVKMVGGDPVNTWWGPKINRDNPDGPPAGYVPAVEVG